MGFGDLVISFGDFIIETHQTKNETVAIARKKHKRERESKSDIQIEQMKTTSGKRNKNMEKDC